MHVYRNHIFSQSPVASPCCSFRPQAALWSWSPSSVSLCWPTVEPLPTRLA